jgi:hypothetical protein
VTCGCVSAPPPVPSAAARSAAPTLFRACASVNECIKVNVFALNFPRLKLSNIRFTPNKINTRPIFS